MVKNFLNLLINPESLGYLGGKNYLIVISSIALCYGQKSDIWLKYIGYFNIIRTLKFFGYYILISFLIFLVYFSRKTLHLKFSAN